MTVELCKRLARTPPLRFVYAAVQNGDTCFGGNDITQYTNTGTCDSPCTGNNQTVCGGAWVNAIYRTGETLWSWVMPYGGGGDTTWAV